MILHTYIQDYRNELIAKCLLTAKERRILYPVNDGYPYYQEYGIAVENTILNKAIPIIAQEIKNWGEETCLEHNRSIKRHCIYCWQSFWGG